jgi:hypothetical protein
MKRIIPPDVQGVTEPGHSRGKIVDTDDHGIRGIEPKRFGSSEPEDEYDDDRFARECVTAAELRARGFAIPMTIPDCGWVRRDELRFDVSVPRMEDFDASATISADLILDFAKPFRWVDVRVKIG